MEYIITALISFLVVLASKCVECKDYIKCRSDFNTIDCYGSGAYCCGMNEDECCWYSVYGYWCSGAYCCGMNEDECCWYSVYGYWWFWFVWFWVFLLIMSCCIWACVRRRRRQARIGYMVVDPQQTYGSVVTTGHPQDYVQPPMYSAVPPSAPSYMQKPPPYSAVANPPQ